MKRAARKHWGMATLLLAGPMACSAQAEPDYRGEPLAVVRGALVTGAQATPSEVDAALVWVTAEEQEDGWPIARVRVRGEFPAQFTIEVFDPPPGSSEPRQEGDQLVQVPVPTSIGVVAAIAPNSGDRVSYDEILGVWLDGGVQYFERDANGEALDLVQSEAERRKIPATQGYHLYRQTSSAQIEGDFFRCMNGDLCEHKVYTGAPFAGSTRPGWSRYQADLQVLNDADDAKCRQYLDHPATCTTYFPEARTAQEQAETDRCQALYQESFDRNVPLRETGCYPTFQYVENHEGFDFPVRIQFGTTWLEWMNPRYHE